MLIKREDHYFLQCKGIQGISVFGKRTPRSLESGETHPVPPLCVLSSLPTTLDKNKEVQNSALDGRRCVFPLF